jgi:hypothetical protein
MMLNALLVVNVLALDVSQGLLRSKGAADPVVHDKVAGEGYQPGSPLHAKQEALKGASEPTTYTAETMPPVSTTMKCIINLTVQYFIIYTAVAIVRTYNGFVSPGQALTKTQATLKAATSTVNFAPMLSVLFLGTRMRALQLSEGKPDDHDLPQPYVKMAMQSCAWAVLAQTIIVLALPLLLGQTPEMREDGSPAEIRSPGIVAQIFGVLRWVLMIMLYGGFTTVCVGAFSMEAPKELWPDGQPPVSPAVACTMNLSMQYFAVYLAIAVVDTWEQFLKKTEETKKLSGLLQLATNTVNFAPMLCILFIGARMRALQLDPKYGNPQPWAQNCFYMCAYSVLVQLILVIAVPYALNGRVKKGDAEGDITFEFDNNPNMYFIMEGVRYVLMLALYGGFTAVICSIFLIKAKEGSTPEVSPTMKCVMNLTVQFFFVYLMLWVSMTLKSVTANYNVTGYESLLTSMISTFDSARQTVQFCPMLAILFVGMRMRALQITNQKGAPQGYAQQAMFLSTYAVMLQVLMVMLMPLFTGGPPKMDPDGNVISTGGSSVMMYITTTIRYLGLIMLYGGAVAVVVALFYITPETATGKGSLVPGVEVPVPPSAPTPE